MKKLFIIGDSHIPDRARDLPNGVKKYLDNLKQSNTKFDKVIFTGDLVQNKDFLKYLQSFALDEKLIIVEGNMDFFYQTNFPENQKFHFEDFPELRFGVIHGHQISPRGDFEKLSRLAVHLGVNILISGHTHKDFAVVKNNILLLNPGSCVGAWSFISSNIPSLMIAEINNINSHKTEIKILIKILYFKDRIKENDFEFIYRNKRWSTNPKKTNFRYSFM
ncbi:MAG: YfcE family phosphodiesterase [Promethearchaeota archaeon]